MITTPSCSRLTDKNGASIMLVSIASHGRRIPNQLPAARSIRPSSFGHWRIRRSTQSSRMPIPNRKLPVWCGWTTRRLFRLVRIVIRKCGKWKPSKRQNHTTQKQSIRLFGHRSNNAFIRSSSVHTLLIYTMNINLGIYTDIITSLQGKS